MEVISRIAYVKSERKRGMKNILRTWMTMPFTNEGKTRKMIGLGEVNILLFWTCYI